MNNFLFIKLIYDQKTSLIEDSVTFSINASIDYYLLLYKFNQRERISLN